jgi:hypothetical protein
VKTIGLHSTVHFSTGKKQEGVRREMRNSNRPRQWKREKRDRMAFFLAFWHSLHSPSLPCGGSTCGRARLDLLNQAPAPFVCVRTAQAEEGSFKIPYIPAMEHMHLGVGINQLFRVEGALNPPINQCIVALGL